MRRRRSVGDVFLIRATDVVSVDPFSDAVFALCDGTSDVLTIIKMMVHRYREHEPVSVAAHTLHNLEYFRERGLIRQR